MSKFNVTIPIGQDITATHNCLVVLPRAEEVNEFYHNLQGESVVAAVEMHRFIADHPVDPRLN